MCIISRFNNVILVNLLKGEGKTMRTCYLLTSLFEIAGLTQKKFSELMDMSPSTVSQICSGQQLVRMNEAASFSSKAARILANYIFNYQCCSKFKDLFPIIIEFYSRQELEEFLEQAFHYALDNDWEAATDIH